MKEKTKNEIRDYEYGFIIGIIAGVGLVPLEMNFNLGWQIYLATVSVMALLGLMKMYVAKFLVHHIHLAWQFVKFIYVGVANAAINIGIFNLLVYFTGITDGLLAALFSAIALQAAIIHSYIWNSHWSFESEEIKDIHQFIKFFFVNIGSLILNIVVVYFLIVLGNNSSIIFINYASLLGLIIAGLWNFVGYKFIVFKS